jgi:hypothetical protein
MLLQQSVLALAAPARAFTGEDLLHWADFSGHLHTSWTEFLVARAAQDQAAAEGKVADMDQVQLASEQFRYDRDITTAEETEAWLVERHLTMDQFMRWLERCYWQANFPAGSQLKLMPFAAADSELQCAFFADAHFSGMADRLVQQFGRRLIARCHPSTDTAPSPEDLEQVLQEFRRRTAEPEDRWLNQLGRDRSWLQEMLALEAAYAVECRHCLTRERKNDLLRSLWLPLTRLRLELISFENLDMAREAMLCLRQDSVGMSELAEATGQSLSEVSRFAEEFPAAVQQRLLSAAPGEVLEPEALGEAYQICRLCDKVEPMADDPDVSQRLERELVDTTFAARGQRFLRFYPTQHSSNEN